MRAHAIIMLSVSSLSILVVYVSSIFDQALYARIVGFLAGLMAVGVVLHVLFFCFSLRGSKSIPYVIPMALTSIGVGAFSVSHRGEVLGFGNPGIGLGLLIVICCLVSVVLFNLSFLRRLSREHAKDYP